MKSIIIFLLILFYTYSTNPQTWAPPGTQWVTGIIESFASANEGYILTTVIGDTILLSQTARILKSDQFNSSGILIKSDTAFLYKANGKIFHYRSGQFYNLYDFNGSAGSSWQISVPYPSPFTISGNPPDTILTIIVDSISIININGVSKKMLYVHSLNNDWRFRNPIIEDIGDSGGLFPFIYDWMDMNIPYLRCYSDSIISYHTQNNIPCDTLINRIENILNEKNEIFIYPNPAHEKLNISLMNGSSQEIKLVSIYNSFGQKQQIIPVETINNDFKIDISSFEIGLYVIQINSTFTTKSFIKN